MFTLAHLSDTHLGKLRLPRLDLLLSKRVLGFLSWHLRRKAIHEGPVLGALVDDLHAAHPDHTVVTGDLVNISLPARWPSPAAVRLWRTSLTGRWSRWKVEQLHPSNCADKGGP